MKSMVTNKDYLPKRLIQQNGYCILPVFHLSNFKQLLIKVLSINIKKIVKNQKK